MKVKIRATSGDHNYPTICGMHEFESIEKAIDFAYYGAKGFNKDVTELVVSFDKEYYSKYYDNDIDLMIEIYDTYRE